MARELEAPTERLLLCAVDFSDASELALAYAVNLAKQLGLEVSVLHVMDPAAEVFPDDVPHRDEHSRKLEAAARQALQELASRHEHDAQLTTLLERGIPHAVIPEKAAQLGAELIVVGTHGRTGLGHVLLGSVAERVVRQSEVPVLTVRKPSG